MNNKLYDISIIIPSYKSEKYLNRLLSALDKQELLPSEIIIIDSLTSLNFLNNIKQKFKSLNIVLKILNETSHPGNKRNLGAKIAKNETIAFLDTKTIPKESWIKDYIQILESQKYDIVFGSTSFSYSNYLQKLINYSTFGNSVHETTPGTILKKSSFISSGQFV
ncbi:glycosyltransferase family 2 protein, partial [Pelagibacteraceae bacterium]|nr:glycosyltransferase family 2 protein [Pelagibacteraceae bacterium]